MNCKMSNYLMKIHLELASCGRDLYVRACHGKLTHISKASLVAIRHMEHPFACRTSRERLAHPQASSSARLGRSWHTYILRHHAQVLGRLGLLDRQHSHTALAPSCLARRDDAASWAKGFQNVAAPLHMFEALGGYDVEERLSLSLKQKTTRKRGINLNGDPRGLDLFKTCFSTASTIMFLECQESMSFGKQQGREKHVAGLPDKQ